MNKIKILIADDEILFRKGISSLLQKEGNIEVVFEADNGQEIIDYLCDDKTTPDIILMDLKMPDLNGVETTKIIQKEYPEIKIIALSSYNTKCFIANMIQVGAVSYLVKNTTPKEVIDTINEVHKKGYFYNDTVMEIINESKFISHHEFNSSFDEDLFLSLREKEILRHICFQLSTPQIAEKLEVSKRTIESHRYNILLKTRSINIAGMVVYAIQNKIVSLDELAMQGEIIPADIAKFSNN